MTAAHKLTPGNVADAFAGYEGFCRSMLDAYAVVDMNGKVVKANQLLGQLLGKSTKQILKANSIDEFIKLKINDKSLLITDIIKQQAATRIDEVRGEVEDLKPLNLIMGVFPFREQLEMQIGAFILIRDVTAETNLQYKYKDAANKSITDPLTTLFTRGYFEDYLNLQMRTLTALPPDNVDQRNLSLVMVDIDFFKKVNDVHGHQAGDYILQTTAGVMKKAFRKTDVVCRYGGEEFLVILPATDVKGALLAAEKLRAAIQGTVITFEDKQIPITISCGVAQIHVGTENYPETLARADAALYEAKKSGRNRVVQAKEQ